MTFEGSIRAGDLAAAIDLLRSGADANRRGPEGLTPLMIAAGLGPAQMVELLLTAGAEVLAIEPRMGATALHKAAQSGNGDVLGLLLDHGAFIDQQSPVLGNTPLMDAVLHKHEEAVRLLLDRGARTTIRNHWQQTALDLAQHDGLEAIIRLIEARDETDAEQVRALTLITAVEAGDVGEVERLIAAEAPVNARAPIVGSLYDDYTPLGLAAREGRADIVRVLLDAGADPRRVIGLMKGTPVHEAAYFGHADVLRAMTEKHRHAGTPAPELDAQGPYNGLTALHDAVWHGHLEAARALVDAGARLDLRTHAGLTLRELALLYGYDDLARYLAEAERASSDPRSSCNDRASEDECARPMRLTPPLGRSPSMTDAIHPHPLAFPDAALDDLRERLARTRWPERETVDDRSQGAPLARMQALCDYWRDGYDWRAAEARLNALDPSMTRIDGLDIHFLHLRSPEPDAVPLVMTHGWPGSVIEFLKVAPLLADPRAHGGDPKDAFHVVLPTLPGFGLSEKPAQPGWTPERIAQAWVVLMQRLGYDRFVAQGGDWGYAITNALGGIGAPAVQAVHFNMFPIYETMEARDAQEEKALKRLQDFKDNEIGYQIEQVQSPQTIGYALTDSPVGQAAWFYEKYEQWTDHDGDPEQSLSRDEMLDNITLYWLTATSASSARIYWQSMRNFKEHEIKVPVGFSQFPRDIHETSRRWVRERYPTLVHYRELPKGGHFAAWEQPKLFAEEVRASFRHSR